MRRTSSLNQSSQEVGIASCRIENPIRAIIEDQSTDCATCGSSAPSRDFQPMLPWTAAEKKRCSRHTRRHRQRQRTHY